MEKILNNPPLTAETLQPILDQNQNLQEKNQQLTEKIAIIVEQYEILKRQFIDLKQQHFGSKREQYIAEQGTLFDEAVVEAPAPEWEHLEFDRKKKRKTTHAHHGIPDHYPRHPIIYELTEAERLCPCGCGTTLQKIGEVVSERLEIKRPELYVNRHVRFKYGGCPHDQGILVAEMPTLPIAKSIAGPSLQSQIVVDKYEYHQPLHRQHKRLRQFGLHLHENSLYDWVCQTAQALLPLHVLLKQAVLHAPIINTDDTPIKVRLKNECKAKKGYLWIYQGHSHPDNPEAIVYNYTTHRSRDGPQAFLGQYEGCIQADGYSAYNELFDKKNPNHPRVRAGCMMHARRRFYKIVQQSRKAGAAHVAMGWIQQLYRIEAEIKALSSEVRTQTRQEQSQPIMDEFKSWLDIKIDQVLKSSPLHDAVQYALNHWVALTYFLKDERLDIDNGRAERGMRPVALGRNNWIALGSHRGGELAALFYSFIETCKCHKVNTFDYFTDVLTRINDHPINRLHELLPYHWSPQSNAEKVIDN